MKFGFVVSTLALGACSSTLPQLPSGAAAYPALASKASADDPSYRISPFDVIGVSVFQEPDLTVRDVQVDAAGMILLPLIGSMSAKDKTVGALADEIAGRLGKRYLQDPRVTVLVQSSVAQKVTVDGSVTEPGVYEIRGRTTLIDALAMAKGPTRVARLQDVVIFREVNGQRMGALFDLNKIRRGEASNPEVFGRDTVVVGLSNVKAAWRDVLVAAPLLSAFRPF